MSWAFHPIAAAEYLGACRHYRAIDPILGRGFVRSFTEAMTAIISHPQAWNPLDRNIRRLLMKRFPYGIHFTIESDQILVLSVTHMRQKPGYLRKRLPQ